MNIAKYALYIFLVAQPALLFAMDKSVDIYALAGAKHSDPVEKLRKKLDEANEEATVLYHMMRDMGDAAVWRHEIAPKDSLKYQILDLRRSDALITGYAIEILLADKGVLIYENFEPAFNLDEMHKSQKSKKRTLEYMLTLIEKRQRAETPSEKEKSYLPEMKIKYSEELELLLTSLEDRDSEIKA